MGVRIFEGQEAGSDEKIVKEAVLFCSTSGWVLGPVFDSHEDAEAFLVWLGEDPRKMSTVELTDRYDGWLKESKQ